MNTYMEYIGSYDAETKFVELLRQVEHGQSFTITRNGVSIAELRPAGQRSIEERLARIQAARIRLTSQGKNSTCGLDRESLRSYAHESMR